MSILKVLPIRMDTKYRYLTSLEVSINFREENLYLSFQLARGSPFSLLKNRINILIFVLPFPSPPSLSNSSALGLNSLRSLSDRAVLGSALLECLRSVENEREVRRYPADYYPFLRRARGEREEGGDGEESALRLCILRRVPATEPRASEEKREDDEGGGR